MLDSQSLLHELVQIGITHLVGIPDNATAALHRELSRQEKIRDLFVTREGEAFALAAGLWIGGKRPCILIQNTGLLESGDSLRGTLVRMQIPALILISCRGYASLPTPPGNRTFESLRRRDLSNPEVDSVALLTEPTLDAWGIPHRSLHNNRDLGEIGKAMDWAEANLHPHALLLESAIQGEQTT